LNALSADALPATPGEIEAFARLWEREAALSGTASLLDCDEQEPGAVAINRLVKQIQSPLIVASRERYRQSGRQVRPLLTLDVPKPSINEQRLVWQRALAPLDLNGHVETL